MEIPYYAPLIAYGVILLIIISYAGFNFYHIFKYGFFDFIAKLNTSLVIAVVLIVLFFTVWFLKDIDWSATLELWSDQGFNLQQIIL